MRLLALAIAATGLLTACESQGTRRPNDITQSNLDTAIRTTRTDPARRQVLIHECRANMRMKPKATHRNFAALMGVTPEAVPTVFCDRVIGGIESGRLTAADLNTTARGEINPRLLAVVQGR